MTDLATVVTFVEGAPDAPAPFRLSDFLDLYQPVDYYALRLAHIAACNAFVGPQFRAAVEALGTRQAEFLERCIAANYTRISRGEDKAPTGCLMDGATPGQEQAGLIPFQLPWWVMK